MTLQLVDEGRISLDDTVERWIPGLVPNASSITVRQLLNHTSGLFDFWNDEGFERRLLSKPTQPWAATEQIRVAVSHGPMFPGGLDRPPLIMDHSLGGTNVQLLLDRGLGAAGVGVASGTVKGVWDLPLSTLRSAFPVLHNPFNRGKAVPLSAKQFHYAFGNTLTREESDKIYERCHVPAASTVLFEVAFANLPGRSAASVNFGKDDRAPLLFIAFGEDHIVPEFPGRPHSPGAPGWEEVADYALKWAMENAVVEKPRGRSGSPVAEVGRTQFERSAR